jgi:multidrug efflux pump
MGIAVISGLILGTLLTLFVIPAVYSAMSREFTEKDAERIRLQATETGSPAPVRG